MNPRLRNIAGVLGIIIIITAGCLGVLLVLDGDREPETTPPHSIVDMPNGYSDVIMRCFGSNGIYTNGKGGLAVIQSDAMCTTPTAG